MEKISRRKAIKYVSTSALLIASSNIPGCCCFRDFLNFYPCDPFKEWKKEGKDWWLERKKERKRERDVAINEGVRPELEIPFPYLICGKQAGPHGWVIDQFENWSFNHWEILYVLITNKGNAPSWNCIVEAYETYGYGTYGKPFSSFTLNDRKIITLMSGESREVELKFRVTRKQGGINLRSIDPFGDPGLLTYEQMERTNSGFVWTLL